jgi:thymidylate synthase
MKRVFEGEHINDIYIDIIKELSRNPESIVRPRGMEIKEIRNATIILTNPKNCLVTLKERKLNYRFATIEKFEFIAGNHKPERLLSLNPNLQGFLNEYGFFDGHYETRLHYWLPYVVGLLKKDPDSRQAVINIYGQQDRHASKDIPCTLTMQFMLRDGKLDMIVNMRSQDLLWGTPYDVNGFCFIMEVIASSLMVELGTYYHNMGSLHLYTEREEQLTKLLENQVINGHYNPTLDDFDFEIIKDQLNGFLMSFDDGCLTDEELNKEVFPNYLNEYVREFKL